MNLPTSESFTTITTMPFPPIRHSCRIILITLALSAPITTFAGKNCDTTPPSAEKTQTAMRFARQVRDTLEGTDARVVLLGRIGSNQADRGVRYTHAAFLLRDHPAGKWTVMHELNNCGSGNSDLFDEGLANFYLDDIYEFETKIAIPSTELQDKLASTLLGDGRRALHEAVYSSIANPWSTRFQNSNGWILETLAKAEQPDQIRTREQAQDWLKAAGYRPSRIHIGGGERAGARLFTPNIRFGDHPDSAWQAQTYEVNTGDSLFNFLPRVDPAVRILTQRLDGKPSEAAFAPSATTRPAAAAQVAVAQVTPTPVATKPVPTPPAAQPIAPAREATVAAPPATTSTMSAPTTAPIPNRVQLLQSMQGLIVTYACRPQGYLNQCRQLDPKNCEKQVSDAVLRCFATVSDQQLNASEQAAMQQMQEIGYCAVESVDKELAAARGAAKTAQGQSCPGVRQYK